MRRRMGARERLRWRDITLGRPVAFLPYWPLTGRLYPQRHHIICNYFYIDGTYCSAVDEIPAARVRFFFWCDLHLLMTAAFCVSTHKTDLALLENKLKNIYETCFIPCKGSTDKQGKTREVWRTSKAPLNYIVVASGGAVGAPAPPRRWKKIFQA